MGRPTRRGFASPVTIFASTARAAQTTFTSDVYKFDSSKAKGLLLIVNCTASSDTPSVVFNIQDTDGGTWTTRLASSALTGAGAKVLVVYPGVGDVANSTETTALVNTKFRVTAVHADADSITYSAQAWYLN